MLKNVPAIHVTDFLLESIERECKAFFGDDFDKIHSIDDIPEEYIQPMRENLNRADVVHKKLGEVEL